MKKCNICNVKLTKTNCFYLYTLFRNTKIIKSGNKKDKDLICDKCYDLIDNEKEKQKYLNKLDQPFYYCYDDEFNNKHFNNYNEINDEDKNEINDEDKNEEIKIKVPIINKKKTRSKSSSPSPKSPNTKQNIVIYPPLPPNSPPPQPSKSNSDSTSDEYDEDENNSKTPTFKSQNDIFNYLFNMYNKDNNNGSFIIIDDTMNYNNIDKKKSQKTEKRKRETDNIDVENKEDKKEEEDEKKYNYEWLGSEISSIDDLIEIGQSYNIRKNKKKRYNLNIRKLNNLVAPLLELKQMIGLSSIKEAIFNQIIFYLQELEDKNTDMLHTVIEGPPGVGKTHICHIIAKIYKGLGFLKNDKVVSVKRDDFIAKYLGQTADKTRRKIEEALGGVLFIDEAYSMGDLEGRDSYSKEAIDMLTSYLSEHPHDLICIVAGYKQALQERFFSQNEGLSRRFTHRFELTDYNAEDLRLIFFKIVEDGKWSIYNKDDIPIDFFDKNIKCFKYNGGDMLTLFGYCKKIHSKRLLKISKEEKILLENKKKLNLQDLEGGLKEFLKNPEYAKRLDEDTSHMVLYT